MWKHIPGMLPDGFHCGKTLLCTSSNERELISLFFFLRSATSMSGWAKLVDAVGQATFERLFAAMPAADPDPRSQQVHFVADILSNNPRFGRAWINAKACRS
jgi:hypothetical protein